MSVPSPAAAARTPDITLNLSFVFCHAGGAELEASDRAKEDAEAELTLVPEDLDRCIMGGGDCIMWGYARGLACGCKFWQGSCQALLLQGVQLLAPCMTAWCSMLRSMMLSWLCSTACPPACPVGLQLSQADAAAEALSTGCCCKGQRADKSPGQ